jgi:hypothetical protein
MQSISVLGGECPALELREPASVSQRVRSTADWLRYFQENASRPRPIPWDSDSRASSAELDDISRSLQAWQLGETSDGSHLRAAAARHADRMGDSVFPAVVDLFVREEQRHGELLGRYLDLTGIGRITSNWGDSLFRRFRYCITDMEIWTTPVVMVESLAMIYYNAIRRATQSTVLQTISKQILADEVPHVRFQCERLAVIFRSHSRVRFWLTMATHRLLFLVIVILVWAGHRRALHAGGYSWRRYWRSAYTKMGTAWRLMDPRRYHWI